VLLLLLGGAIDGRPLSDFPADKGGYHGDCVRPHVSSPFSLQVQVNVRVELDAKRIDRGARLFFSRHVLVPFQCGAGTIASANTKICLLR